MGKTVCIAKKNHKVPSRGRASIEWHDENGKPQYYCYGWINKMTDELLEVCKNCKDNVIHAQDDFDKYNEKVRGDEVIFVPIGYAKEIVEGGGVDA